MDKFVASNQSRAWPSQTLGWLALLLLSLAAVASYLDRVAVNLLVEPIKAAFHLTDTGFAALQAIAFGVFYTTMALPLGRLADSRNRRLIVIVGLGLFSLCSMGSGLASRYWQLFLARTGVGVGEASLTPAAYSMLSDYFPPGRLGRVLGIFTMSAYFGIGLAFMLGGAAVGWLSRPGVVADGSLHGLAPWQIAFLLVGAPGLALTALLLPLLREPPRRGAEPIAPIGEVALQFWRRRRVLVPMFAGFGLVALSGYAATSWIPALFIRAFGWSPERIGFWYGLMYTTFGIGGAGFAGWLCDHLTARGHRDAPLKIAAFGFLGVAIFGVMAPLASGPWQSLALFAPAVFLSIMPYPLAATAIQLVTPNTQRGQATALYLTIINLIGLGLGPLLVGVFNDHLFTGPDGVRLSLSVVNLICAPVATALLLYASKPYRALRMMQASD